MAFAITNKGLTLPTEFDSVLQSTSQMQYVATSTAASSIGGWAHQEFGDYTTTGPVPLQSQVSATGIGDFGAAYRTWRAFVSFKSLTAGTATSTAVIGGPMVTLEVATSTAAWVGAGSSGPGINFQVLDCKYVFGTTTTSTGATQTIFLFGQTALVAGAQFARVNFYNPSGVGGGNSSSTALDIVIEAA